MTTRYYNSAYEFTNDNAVFITPATSDAFYFGKSADIAATGYNSDVMSLSGGNVVTVAGALFGTEGAITGGGSGGNDVLVTQTGQLSGGDFSVELVGGNNSLENAGVISGTAIFAGTGNTFSNSGTVLASGYAVNFNLPGCTVSNSGALIGSGGIVISDYLYQSVAESDVVNSGTILAHNLAAVGLYGSNGSLHLTNTGTLAVDDGHTAVQGSFGGDAVVNAGLISGNVDLGGGDDSYDGSHGQQTGTVSGGDGNDTLIGSDTGGDVLDGGTGADFIDGGGGADTASYASSYDPVTVDLLDASKNSGDAFGDTLISIERLRGGLSADTLSGDDSDNRISGNGGNDMLAGRGGNDVLYGGSYNDVLDGGLGNDRLDGGIDSDTATYASATVGVTVSLAIAGAQNTTGAGIDTLVSIENLTGSRLADHLAGDVGANTLSGGNGNDVLDGGLGNDTLVGGKDQDTFVFSTSYSGNLDTILDFVVADDTIDLAKSIFTAFASTGPIAAGNLVIGTGPADANDFLIYNSNTGALSYDPDGSGSALAVQFATLHTHLALTSADFVVI